jgi:exopolysaccharide biosynthesis polyprenyl glycosylphosphotransferase
LAAVFRPLFNEIRFIKEIAQPIELQTGIYVISLLVWVGILFYSSVYDVRKNTQFYEEFTNLIFASAVAALALAGILYFTYREISRLLFLIFVFEVVIFTSIWRLLPWILIWLGVRGDNTRAVAIVGSSKIAKELGDRIKESPQLNMELIGYINDDKTDQVIATLSGIRETVEQYDIEDVFIALPREQYDLVDRLVQRLYDLPVTVWVIPDYFSLVLQRAEVEEFAGIPMLNLRAPALKDHQILFKRIFDLVLAVVLTPFVALAMVLIAVVLKIEGKGPIFFVQERVGQNGRLFKMYKFRTMVAGSERNNPSAINLDEAELISHKLPDDPRITKIGKFLRKSSLDELPQLFNIYLGNMSFVGPRPELPWIVAGYEKWQHKRFAISPGMTGWWQIKGRSDRPMHLHTEDDLYYIQNYSILLDIKILIITAWKVITGEGAY